MNAETNPVIPFDTKLTSEPDHPTMSNPNMLFGDRRDMQYRFITVVYKRSPDSVSRTRQLLLWEGSEGMISLGLLNPSEPIIHAGHTLVDDAYLGVWFVREGLWYDVGAIYDRQGSFVGYYSDIATPIVRSPGGYEMTDLFLDLWVYPDGQYVVLDRDEFAAAVREGILETSLAVKAESELENLIHLVKSSGYPPNILRRFSKEPRQMLQLAAALR